MRKSYRSPASTMAILLAGASLLTACAGARSASGPSGAVPYRYVCFDGSAFIARFSPGEVVLDFGGGETRTLAARANEPTATYGDARAVFRPHGDLASFTRVHGPAVSCRRGDIRDFVVFW